MAAGRKAAASPSCGGHGGADTDLAAERWGEGGSGAAELPKAGDGSEEGTGARRGQSRGRD